MKKICGWILLLVIFVSIFAATVASEGSILAAAIMWLGAVIVAGALIAALTMIADA